MSAKTLKDFNLFNDLVLIERIPEGPNNWYGRSFCIAKIVAVGPGRRDQQKGELIPMRVKVGDEVLIRSERFDDKVIFDQKEYEYIFEDQLIGKFN